LHKTNIIRRIISARTGLLSLAVLGTLAHPALAGTITTLGALGANDIVNLSGLPPGAISTAVSTGGITVTFLTGLNLGQEIPAGGWAGDFPANTTIVTNQTGSVATLDFSSPIEGFGVTLDDGFGGNFTETIKAYSGSSTLLDTATANQTSQTLLFLGLLESSEDISSITIGVTGIGGTNDFGFGNPSLVDGTSLSPTPEPQSAFLTVVGGGLLVLLRDVRKKMRS
jgi:hypothetical protein